MWAQLIGRLQGVQYRQPPNYFELQWAYLGDDCLDASVLPKHSWNVWLWFVFQLKMLQEQEDFYFYVPCCVLPLLGSGWDLTAMCITSAVPWVQHKWSRVSCSNSQSHPSSPWAVWMSTEDHRIIIYLEKSDTVEVKATLVDIQWYVTVLIILTSSKNLLTDQKHLWLRHHTLQLPSEKI